MTRDQRQFTCAALGASAVLFCAALAQAYPLDGEPESGIRRLAGYRLAQERPTGSKLVAGALLGHDEIALGLTLYTGPDFDRSPEDPELKAALEALFRSRDASYALAIVDLSDPEHIRWAGLRPDTRQNVGSVGKILCMIGLFDALARAFPDADERARVLAETVVRGGEWVLGDEHAVPHFHPDTGVNTFVLLRADDQFRLSEWLDHAISVSANGAGAVIWREAMLVRHFGARYPVAAEESAAFFRETPKAELAALAQQVLVEPLEAAGIDTQNIRQGSFWTNPSKRIVPGTSSFATPRELARIMFRMEEGKLVDAWSSLEMKRYLYMTKRRYRYVYAPELARSAVFFKSGSLYSCKPEEGYRCRRYEGNERNFMNSVVTVESPAGGEAEHRYIASLISNVLKTNSAWDHSRIGAAIHELVVTRGPVTLREKATAGEVDAAGKSD
jgi:Beta-lactamase enzyme family